MFRTSLFLLLHRPTDTSSLPSLVAANLKPPFRHFVFETMADVMVPPANNASPAANSNNAEGEGASGRPDNSILVRIFASFKRVVASFESRSLFLPCVAHRLAVARKGGQLITCRPLSSAFPVLVFLACGTG